MAEHPIRLGILGCAEIARKLSQAIALAHNAAAAIAVGSRSLEKAQRFIADNGLPPATRAHGSYEAVLDDRAVDAVYVPLPTSLHKRWAVAAAERGKHVLLEKPTALSVANLDRNLEACGSAGVEFTDAPMWLHHPRTARMQELLSDAGLFGPLKSTTCDFMSYIFQHPQSPSAPTPTPHPPPAPHSSQRFLPAHLWPPSAPPPVPPQPRGPARTLYFPPAPSILFGRFLAHHVSHPIPH